MKRAHLPTLVRQADGLEERLWSRVDMSGGAGACWTFRGAKNPKGYGVIKVMGRQFPASRVAYQLAIGDVPHGLEVCHTCDNPPCCNPAHLWLGTALQNTHDKMAKGRFSNGGPKLASSDVAMAEMMLAQGIRQAEIAKVFGVSQTLVSRIKRGCYRPEVQA